MVVNNLKTAVITSPVRAVARNTHNPSTRHWKAVLMIISYLRVTNDLGVRYVRGSGLDLSVYMDADYADKANDSRFWGWR